MCWRSTARRIELGAAWRTANAAASSYNAASHHDSSLNLNYTVIALLLALATPGQAQTPAFSPSQPSSSAPALRQGAAVPRAANAKVDAPKAAIPKALATNAPAAVAPKAGATAGEPGAVTDIVRAQVLLGRAHFSSGEIDGAAGSNLRKAVTGYQKLQQLPVTGKLDDATWARLKADQAPVLDVYTISAQDIAGPYVKVPPTMAEKAKLSTLGYANLLEALGERFHSSPALLRKLNPGKSFARVGEQVLVPHVLGTKPLPKAATLLVDAKEGTLTLLDASGTPIAQFPASTGSKHDPLPEGRWQVLAIATNPEYRYNPKLFWDAKPGEGKARIAPGPNNPVGVAWIDLSKDHYGIHGTPEPAKIGKTQSHGCVRLTNWDVMKVVKAISKGVTVLLQA